MDKKKDISVVNYPTRQKEIDQKFLDPKFVEKCKKVLMDNNFADGLVKLGISKEHLLRWNVGSTQAGHTTFFYQNIKGQYVTTKIFKLVFICSSCNRS